MKRWCDLGTFLTFSKSPTKMISSSRFCPIATKFETHTRQVDRLHWNGQQFLRFLNRVWAEVGGKGWWLAIKPQTLISHLHKTRACLRRASDMVSVALKGTQTASPSKLLSVAGKDELTFIVVKVPRRRFLPQIKSGAVFKVGLPFSKCLKSKSACRWNTADSFVRLLLLHFAS